MRLPPGVVRSSSQDRRPTVRRPIVSTVVDTSSVSTPTARHSSRRPAGVDGYGAPSMAAAARSTTDAEHACRRRARGRRRRRATPGRRARTAGRQRRPASWPTHRDGGDQHSLAPARAARGRARRSGGRPRATARPTARRPRPSSSTSAAARRPRRVRVRRRAPGAVRDGRRAGRAAARRRPPVRARRRSRGAAGRGRRGRPSPASPATGRPSSPARAWRSSRSSPSSRDRPLRPQAVALQALGDARPRGVGATASVERRVTVYTPTRLRWRPSQRKWTRATPGGPGHGPPRRSPGSAPTGSIPTSARW